MADIIYVAVIVAFFALSVLFVNVCDHIIGPDETSMLVSAGPPDEAAAHDGDGREAIGAGTVHS